ncbi:MAG: gliding motility protein GldN [Chlorobi bacterium]|nr:gliding motility protein GldN [Chlorobiota bacterium]
MKKFVIFILISSLFIVVKTKSTNAQVLDGVYDKEHIPSRKPVKYYNLREADVMWKKRIWRIIDLREKINQPLYFPTEKIGDRMSLIDLLLWGINNEGITPYEAKYDDRFLVPMTRAQIDEAFGAGSKTVTIQDAETGEMVEKTEQIEKNTSEVKQYMLKEDWFFDNQRSVMDVRILGICPIREYYNDDDIDQTDMQRSKVFWIYFPEARRILANHEVFNPFNDAERKTFDDIFFKRMFNSYTSAESNVYNNRTITEYNVGLNALLEAQKIKNDLFKMEVDLWEY